MRYKLQLIIIGYLLLSIGVIIFYDGTGDTGDSIMHYLISRYAWAHPELLLDHWGKPFFTLVSSSFAQFGIVGIKLFNILMAAAGLFFTVETTAVLFPNTGQKWYISPLWLALFYIATPLPFVLTFSGLTEPLFAALLSARFYFLIIKNNWKTAAGLISFLPFVRSEGLIIIGVWGIYFLSKYLFNNTKTGQFKSLNQLIQAGFLLSLGHIFYALLGLIFKGDLFWVFSEIPYAQIKEAYGSGDLSHFAVQLTYILGIPIYVFLMIGIIGGIAKLFYLKRVFFYSDSQKFNHTVVGMEKNVRIHGLRPVAIQGSTTPRLQMPSEIEKLKKDNYRLEKVVLIGGGFLAFFIAHSLFWYLGIFKSMGLNRVFVGIMPLMAIVAFCGYKILIINVIGRGVVQIKNFTDSFYSNKVSCFFAILFLLYVAIFPLTSNPAAVKWERDLSLLPEQLLLQEVADFLLKNQLDGTNTIYYAHPYLAVALEIDPFGEDYQLLDQFKLESLPANSIIVWDNWFAPIDKNVTRANLVKDLPLQLIQRFSVQDKREVVFEIYQKE